jgi:GTPase SAR1 family protein
MQIMSEYHLGPNGAILTALNLYTAQPERIVERIEQLSNNSPRNCFLIDIPGQIEAFTWSASSMILTKAIGMLMPVVLVFVVDGKRCQNPSSFLSNLLFARIFPG